MDVYRFGHFPNQRAPFETGTIMLLGEFEFFHQGHHHLLQTARAHNEHHLPIGIILLDQKQPQMVQSLSDRLYTLAALGFDFAVVATFDVAFKTQSGWDFINTLVHHFNVHTFVSGADFYFGANRAYHANQIATLTKHSVRVIVCSLQTHHDHKIASRSLKQMYQFGELHLVRQLLVYPLVISVTLHGGKLIWLTNLLKPHVGLYYFKILINHLWYHGLLHFGFNQAINFRLINGPTTPIFNQRTMIQLLDPVRIIINSRFDQILPADLTQARWFFQPQESHED